RDDAWQRADHLDDEIRSHRARRQRARVDAARRLHARASRRSAVAVAGVELVEARGGPHHPPLTRVGSSSFLSPRRSTASPAITVTRRTRRSKVWLEHRQSPPPKRLSALESAHSRGRREGGAKGEFGG